MEQLKKETLTTSRSLQYTYYISSSSKPSFPTVLLLHGWPDSAHLWSDLIGNHLLPAGYGVLALDCLGYAGSSKPTTTSSYNSEAMSADLVEILDANHIPKVISLGHDWGCFLAQRLWLWHPERVIGLAMLNVAYSPPAGPFDLEAILNVFKQTFGQGLYYYWRLFTSDEGPSILNAHLESLFTALHARKLDHMKDTFATEDGMKNYLLADRRQELAAYATPEMQREFVARFQRDGFAAPLQWYRAVTENVHWAVEQNIPAQRLKVTVPALFVACTHDNVCPPVLIQQSVQAGLLPDLVVRELDSSHWSPFEKPEELGAVVREWLDGNFGAEK